MNKDTAGEVVVIASHLNVENSVGYPYLALNRDDSFAAFNQTSSSVPFWALWHGRQIATRLAREWLLLSRSM
jgi:hypothetical protein